MDRTNVLFRNVVFRNCGTAGDRGGAILITGGVELYQIVIEGKLHVCVWGR